VQSKLKALDPLKPCHIVLVGIEAHICVLQTALDLRRSGYEVAVLADGISSCNPEEIPIAVTRMRHGGVIVTTSESWLYECMGDASIKEYVVIRLLTGRLNYVTRLTLLT
jgi:nicotinamidase-related amidase